MPTQTAPTNAAGVAEDMQPKVFLWVKERSTDVDLETNVVMQEEIPIISVGTNVSPSGGVPTLAFNYVLDGSTWDRLRGAGNDADGVAVNTDGLMLNNTHGLLFNETTFDRQRGNTEETLLASAARTASVDSADFTNFNATGAHFIVDVSAIAATPSIVVTIQGKDPISGNYYDILVATAITTVGTTVLKVHPGIGAIAGGAANDILPRVYRVSVANADADSITYSIGANLVL